MTPDRENAYIKAIGEASAHVAWALAAVEHAETTDAAKFLAKAQESIRALFPHMSNGPSPYYIPRPKVKP